MAQENQPAVGSIRILLAALRQGHAVSIPGTSGQRVTLTSETRAELVRELEQATAAVQVTP